MGYAIQNGKVVINTGLFSEGFDWSIQECFELDAPNHRNYEIAANGALDAYILTEEELKLPRVDLFNAINRSGKTQIAVDPAIFNLDRKRLTAVLETLIRELNAHNNVVLTKDQLDLAIKNKALYKMLQVTDDPENLGIASTSVDTVTAEPKEIADSTPAAGEKRRLSYDNPASIFEMQITNMVGKEVIGIAAVSLKSFFAESAYYNQIVTNIENIVSQWPFTGDLRKELLKELSKLSIGNPISKGEASSVLANVNYNELLDILGSLPSPIILSQRDLQDYDIFNIYYNPYTGDDIILEGDSITLYDLIDTYKFIADANDACFGDSGLLSLATDFLC